MWCWEGCGSTAGLPAPEKQPHCPEAASGPAGGDGWVPSDDLGLCQPLQPAEPQGLPACRCVASVLALPRVEDRDTGCFEDSV